MSHNQKSTIAEFEILIQNEFVLWPQTGFESVKRRIIRILNTFKKSASDSNRLLMERIAAQWLFHAAMSKMRPTKSIMYYYLQMRRNGFEDSMQELVYSDLLVSTMIDNGEARAAKRLVHALVEKYERDERKPIRRELSAIMKRVEIVPGDE